jgi:signal transduction histidine kinase
MQTLDNIYVKMSPVTDHSTLAHLASDAAPGELANEIKGEVAHELSNVLTIISGYAELLVLKHGNNPELRPQLQLILDYARRAGTIIRSTSKHQFPA